MTDSPEDYTMENKGSDELATLEWVYLEIRKRGWQVVDRWGLIFVVPGIESGEYLNNYVNKSKSYCLERFNDYKARELV